MSYIVANKSTGGAVGNVPYMKAKDVKHVVLCSSEPPESNQYTASLVSIGRIRLQARNVYHHYKGRSKTYLTENPTQFAGHAKEGPLCY